MFCFRSVVELLLELALLAQAVLLSDVIPVTFPPCQAGWVQSDSSEGLPVPHEKLSPGPGGRSQQNCAGEYDLEDLGCLVASKEEREHNNSI